jgi:hypothetical protein
MKFMVKKYIKRLRYAYRILESFLTPLTRGAIKRDKLSNRIMIVYDTTRQPFAIGDFLVTQIAGLINCQKFNVKLCDIAIIYDPNNPASSDSVFSGLIGKDNVLLQITTLMSILNMNSCIGSLFLFNSKIQAEEHINRYKDSYKNIYPGYIDYAGGTYLNHLIFNELIYSFYLKKNFIPKLEPSKALNLWANYFIEEHVGELFPVSVNIRNNFYWGNLRNSKITEWKRFFEYCIDKFPVKFIVLCSKNEISNELRLPNVIFAKDYYTELDQELSLIANSRFHMGANSGPAAMAYFGSNPYFIFGLDINYNSHSDFLYDGLIKEIGTKKFKFIFSSLGQSFTSEPESFDLLCQSFLEMFNMTYKLPKKNYKKDILKSDSRFSWMR